MKRILLAYATRHGQTRRVIQHIAQLVGKMGIATEVRDLAKDTRAIHRGEFSGAILAGSIQLGRHERELIRFARANATELAALPTAFLSVSGSAATAARKEASERQRSDARQRLDEAIAEFVRATRWQPNRVLPVAGAMMYTKYNPLLRFVLKRIVKSDGGPTDTSRDHEFTDWAALDRFVEVYAAPLAGRPAPAEV